MICRTHRAGIHVTLLLAAFAMNSAGAAAQTTHPNPVEPPAEIVRIDPPEDGFYAKRLDYDGIAIKASDVVADAALHEARRRLALQLAHLPAVRANLARRGAELHIIGKDQHPSDLPELREYKGKPWDGGTQTIDERTRGVGGLLTSCGEENLLKLPKDRYRGRDICAHEFAHCILDHGGVPDAVRARFDAQRKQSLERGLWVGAYAGTNEHEFFAELTMWYFGTHGDLNMHGPKPADGPAGLKAYDPEAFALIDDFYSGRIDIPRD